MGWFSCAGTKQQTEVFMQELGLCPDGVPPRARAFFFGRGGRSVQL